MQWNKHNTISLSFFFSAQTENPYTGAYKTGGNPFGNSANTNLPYIPKDQNDIRLADYTLNEQIFTAARQYKDLNTLIENDTYLKTRRG